MEDQGKDTRDRRHERTSANERATTSHHRAHALKSSLRRRRSVLTPRSLYMEEERGLDSAELDRRLK